MTNWKLSPAAKGWPGAVTFVSAAVVCETAGGVLATTGVEDTTAAVEAGTTTVGTSPIELRLLQIDPPYSELPDVEHSLCKNSYSA